MARRALSRLAALGTGALLLAGCLPAERPYWVIDHTDALALRFEVAQRGPWGAEPPASGGPVAEAMPGDRVRVEPFVAGVDGPVDMAALRPRFFACPVPGCSVYEIADAPPDCGAVALPPAEHCLIGQGWPLEFEVGAMVDVVAVLNYGVPVMMVAGTPEGPTTEECLRRVARLDEESAPVQDCLFFARSLRIGPAWLALLQAALSGAGSPVEPQQLPWDVVLVEADVAPAVAGFYAWVPAPGGERLVELPVGGKLSVRTGETIALGVVAGNEPQLYLTVAIDPADGAVSTSLAPEARATIWYATAGSPFYLDADLSESTWTAPDEPGEAVLYALLSDVRSAGVGWLRVEVEP